MIKNKRMPAVLRNIPVNSNGKLFTSPMPFGEFDPGKRLLKMYDQNAIRHIFVLATDEEINKKAKRNIFKQYMKHGISYSRYIIKDFQAPSTELLGDMVREAVTRLKEGQHILIHCYAGVGRTALTTACIIIAVEGLTATEAIAYVKNNMSVTLTSEQTYIIEKFGQLADEAIMNHDK